MNFNAGFLKRKPNVGRKYYSKSRHRYKTALQRLVGMGELIRIPKKDQGDLIAYRLLPAGTRSLSDLQQKHQPANSHHELKVSNPVSDCEYLHLFIPLEKETQISLPQNQNLLSFNMQPVSISDDGITNLTKHVPDSNRVFDESNSVNQTNSSSEVLHLSSVAGTHYVAPQLSIDQCSGDFEKFISEQGIANEGKINMIQGYEQSLGTSMDFGIEDKTLYEDYNNIHHTIPYPVYKSDIIENLRHQNLNDGSVEKQLKDQYSCICQKRSSSKDIMISGFESNNLDIEFEVSCKIHFPEKASGIFFADNKQ